MNTKLDKLLTHSERLLSLKPYDPLITWSTWGHLTIWKTVISTTTRLIVSKLDMLLTYERTFSTQTLKSSPTSSFFCFFSLLVSFFQVISVSCFCRPVWPRLEFFQWTYRLIIVPTFWNFLCEHGMPCTLRINTNGGLKQRHEESCTSTTKNILSPLP